MRFNQDRGKSEKPARDRARTLRQEATLPEAKLWKRLRSGRLGGLKFRRQHPIGPYTADFFCAEASLVIELDGRRHDRERDARRDAHMTALGLHVLRVSVTEFESNTDGVLSTILRTAQDLISTKGLPPSPRPAGRGPG
jgi:very-short-patch-repair endonuclease